jgi:class 3 adenylate cyclase/TolB-like protein/tetratricopeptide (TPR) repeat protein
MSGAQPPATSPQGVEDPAEVPSDTRRLTTIMALDVVGYSRAAERDDAAAAAVVRNLGSAIAEIVTPLGGRIFNTAGDGFMLEFPSAASGVQAAMALLNGGPTLPKIRIGLHLGDVIAQPNGDLLGHGVNVAARLQALAEPGTAMVSETVRAQVRSASELPFELHGRVQLDKMSERLAVFSLDPAGARGVGKDGRRRVMRLAGAFAAVVVVALAIGTGAYFMRGGTGAAASSKVMAQPGDALTLAVMPFDALSANGGDDLLAKGMSREIRNTLSRVRGLKVLADASSLAAAEGKMSATDLGEKRWADLVINGSLTRMGETVKLTAELVDAKTGLNVWAGDKSGPAADLDRLRGLMSAALFQEIVARVGPNRLQQLAPPRPMDPRAYQLTLEAYQIMTTLSSIQQRGAREEALDTGDRADALLDEALAIEADNTEALMLKGILPLSVSTHALAKSGATQQDRLARSAEFFRRALAVDPDNAEALVNLAEHYRRNEWRWAEARPLFERALAVDPNNIYARSYWSYYLSGAGRCIEALEQTRIIRELNPADKTRLPEARILKCLGQTEASDTLYKRAIEADRANLFVLSEYYFALLARRDEKGLRELARHTRDDLWGGKPSAAAADWLARMSEAADALEGKPETFLRRLDGELRAFEGKKSEQNGRRGSDRYWTFAIEYAQAGETSHAIELLGRALKEGSLYIPDTMPYGLWEFTPAMRKDPRYQALWRNDPRLVELMRLRLEALKARQFSGVMPDGTHVDALPVKLTEDRPPS